MKAEETGIFEAKTHFSELVDRVHREGKVYLITKRGKPVAELKPIEKPEKPVGLPYGYGKGTVEYIAPDFDEPLEAFKDYQ